MFKNKIIIVCVLILTGCGQNFLTNSNNSNIDPNFDNDLNLPLIELGFDAMQSINASNASAYPVSGICEPSHGAVTLTIGTPDQEETFVCNENGTFSGSIDVSAVTDNPPSVEASQESTDGSVNTASPSPPPLNDQILPVSPVVSSPVDGSETSDNSTVAGDAGSAEPGSTVTATGPNGETCTATVLADGSYSCSLAPALADGAGQVISVAATDAAGNASPATTVTVDVDATAPAAPLVSNPVDGASTSDNSTVAGGPGSAEPGSTVTATGPNGETCAATVLADGSYSCSLAPALADGVDQAILVTSTDTLGNASLATTVTVDVDTVAPTVAINQAAAQADPTGAQPILFDVVFSEEIAPASFTVADIANTTAGSNGVFNIQTSVDNINFVVEYSGASEEGVITPEIAAGLVEDLAGFTNSTSTATDNSVTLDLTAPAINITSAATITPANESAWPVTGTCSEDGREVTVVLEPGNTPGDLTPLPQPACQPDGTWSASIDTTAITIVGTYNLEVTHADIAGNTEITSASVSRDATCTSPPDAITDLVAANTAQSTTDLSWGIPNDNGAAITDYIVELRAIDTTEDWTLYPDGTNIDNIVTVSGLDPSTRYEFRVRATQTPTCVANLSNLVEVLTKPDHPMFDLGNFEVVNTAGAEVSRVVAFDDSTVVLVFDTPTDYRNNIVSQTLNLDAGDVAIIDPSVKGMVLQSVNPIYASGNLSPGNQPADVDVKSGNPPWASPLWAEKIITANNTRNGPAVIDLYNFEAGADIFVRVGDTVIASQLDVAADTMVKLIIDKAHVGSGSGQGSFIVDATGFVFGTIYSTDGSGSTVGIGAVDDMPFLPGSKKIYGHASVSGFIATASDTAGSITMYHANGAVQDNLIGKSGGSAIAGTSSCRDMSQSPVVVEKGNFTSIYSYGVSSNIMRCNVVNDNSLFVGAPLYIESDVKISGNNTADSNGNNSAPFVPFELFKRRYAIPCEASYLAMVSDRPVVLDEYDSSGVFVQSHSFIREPLGAQTPDGTGTVTVYDTKTPYRLRLSNVGEPGSQFVGQNSDDIYAAWFQCNANTSDPLGNYNGFSRLDETLLYGFD